MTRDRQCTTTGHPPDYCLSKARASAGVRVLAIGLAAAFLLSGALVAPGAGWPARAGSPDLHHRLYLPLSLLVTGPGGGLPSLAHGVSVANLSNAGRVNDLGFRWLKNQVSWASVQATENGPFNWGDLDNIVAAGSSASLSILLRVDSAPQWAHPGNASTTAPPDEAHLQAYGDFLAALVQRAGQGVQAYEIWNEPNLSYEWGNQPPSPAYYARLLQVAYPRIKAAKPQAVVVTAGLATTGGDGGTTALDDVAFLNAMYAAGAKGYFDALGSHPYGFASSPDQLNANGVTHFRRAADQRQVMVNHGDAGRQVWATEFGWLLDSGCNWPDRNWQKVSEQAQADYTVRAYEVARTEWPWMGAMFVFNLDYSTVPWYLECEPMRSYSLLHANGTPRLVYNALKSMPK